jgi:hypothetical protein
MAWQRNIAFTNRPFSTEAGDHLSNTELDDLFKEKTWTGDNPFGESERANLQFSPMPVPQYTMDTGKRDPFAGGKPLPPGTGKTKNEEPTPPDEPVDGPSTPPGGSTPTTPDYGWASRQYGGTFSRPSPQQLPGVPEYTAPDRPTLPEFQHAAYEKVDPFKAPSLDEARRDPGFEFRMKEGQRALEQSAAAKGMLRSGQTWKDLQKYGQQMGELGYQNVYNRQLGEWDRRAQQNLLDYQTGFDSQRQLYDAQRRNVEQGYEWEREAAQDIFEPQITSWGQRHATAQRQNELAYDRARQEYLDDVEAYERNRNRRYNVLTGLM